MPANTEKVKVLHQLEAYPQPLTQTNELVANVIDGNVQLYVLSQIPDKVKGVAEMILDCQVESSRVNFVADTS